MSSRLSALFSSLFVSITHSHAPHLYRAGGCLDGGLSRLDGAIRGRSIAPPQQQLTPPQQHRRTDHETMAQQQHNPPQQTMAEQHHLTPQQHTVAQQQQRNSASRPLDLDVPTDDSSDSTADAQNSSAATQQLTDAPPQLPAQLTPLALPSSPDSSLLSSPDSLPSQSLPQPSSPDAPPSQSLPQPSTPHSTQLPSLDSPTQQPTLDSAQLPSPGNTAHPSSCHSAQCAQPNDQSPPSPQEHLQRTLSQEQPQQQQLSAIPNEIIHTRTAAVMTTAAPVLQHAAAGTGPSSLRVGSSSTDSDRGNSLQVSNRGSDESDSSNRSSFDSCREQRVVRGGVEASQGNWSEHPSVRCSHLGTLGEGLGDGWTSDLDEENDCTQGEVESDAATQQQPQQQACVDDRKNSSGLQECQQQSPSSNNDSSRGSTSQELEEGERECESVHQPPPASLFAATNKGSVYCNVLYNTDKSVDLSQIRQSLEQVFDLRL